MLCLADQIVAGSAVVFERMVRLHAILLTLFSVGFASAGEIAFNRDVRPILANKCFACHGPDEKARKAKLRLDQRDSALQVIEPGAPDQSELIARITHSDQDEVMPPADTHKPVTAEEVVVLRKWIEEGAEFEAHWALIPPVRAEVPDPQVAIDFFVDRRLQEEGMVRSRPVSRRALIRRVSLDLTGLPPTPEEVASFLSDDAPDAYEQLVDRLLASPRYGEHMASSWLDEKYFNSTMEPAGMVTPPRV